MNMNRYLTNWVAFLAGFAAICFIARAMGAEPDTDLPREQPATATGFVYCEGDKKSIVAVIVTYPSGAFVRFDKDHMHGMHNVQELIKYADSAPDTAVYGAGMCNATST